MMLFTTSRRLFKVHSESRPPWYVSSGWMMSRDQASSMYVDVGKLVLVDTCR